MAVDRSQPRSIQSVQNTCRLLNTLQELEGAGVTELSNRLGLSKATVYNHLSTLKGEGFVVQEGDVYKPSLLFLYFGKRIQSNNVLFRKAKPVIDELAEESDEYVHLVVEEHGRSIYLYKTQGTNAVGNRFPVGRRDFLHHSAAGKSILAHLPTDRVDEIVDQHGLPELTQNTITDRENLWSELEKIRENGYSLNLEEEIKGVHAVGSAIEDDEGRVMGAVSISGPTTRLGRNRLEGEIANMVKNAVNIIEIKLSTQ